jgi:hypothetical protein
MGIVSVSYRLRLLHDCAKLRLYLCPGTKKAQHHLPLINTTSRSTLSGWRPVSTVYGRRISQGRSIGGLPFHRAHRRCLGTAKRSRCAAALFGEMTYPIFRARRCLTAAFDIAEACGYAVSNAARTHSKCRDHDLNEHLVIHYDTTPGRIVMSPCTPAGHRRFIPPTNC